MHNATAFARRRPGVQTVAVAQDLLIPDTGKLRQ